jgi:site-specific DNA-methyltransferase (adenine-specific)
MIKRKYPDDFINKIICGDCLEVMKEMPDKCMDLVITSPPYNASKEYENDLSPNEWLKFLSNINTQIYRILRAGGRYALNITFDIQNQSLGNMKILPLAFLSLGNLSLKDLICWNQLNTESDTAWGSWKSASAPHFRHQCEYIIISYKETWHHGKGISSISSRNFTRWTIDHWNMCCARKNEHPAPFPQELPARLINLLSFEGELILDPFLGSGTTARAAKDLRRNFIGIEINPDYCKIAEERLAQGVL